MLSKCLIEKSSLILPSNQSSNNHHLKASSVGLILCVAFITGVLFGSVCWAVCPSYNTAVSVGTVESGQSVLIDEASGIAASNGNPNIFWINNDSGDAARIFAINNVGKRVGTYNLSGAGHYDYEDIAVGPGPDAGQQYIYVSDTGDNAHARQSITVYRVPEPIVNYQQSPVTVNLSDDDVVALSMRYPSTVYDCETLLVDPVSGDIFLVTRDRRAQGYAYVYRNPAPHTPGVMVTLELVATIPYGIMIKGGAISPEGGLVILRPHPSANALLWQRAKTSSIGATFSQPYCNVSLYPEVQGEAICFDSDGCDYYTISERANQSLYKYTRHGLCSEPKIASDFDGDGFVNMLDYSYWAYHWLRGDCHGINSWCQGADLDHLGNVDLQDLFLFVMDWMKPPSLNIAVASSNDDAEELLSSAGSMYFNSTDIELINDPGRGNQKVGLRFTNVNIEPGQNISKAYIQFTVDEISAGACSLNVMVETSDNSAAFTSTAYNISNRLVTSAVAWNPPDWTIFGQAGTNQQSSDIATLIKQITDRPGWASGNAITVIISGSGRRTAFSFDGNPAMAPVLRVEF